MHVDDDNRSGSPAPASGVPPTGPPVDPADRPRIEPADALPTGDEPGLLDDLKSVIDGEKSEEAVPAPAVTTSAKRPAPPAADPADRPSIEPTDALPTEE